MSYRKLCVSANKRFLTYENGEQFFYLGDTAWEIFHVADRADVDLYLADRAAKGFTVIQAAVLAEFDGLHVPNAYGETPMIDDDPTMPNEAYFEHVDWVVARAADYGLLVGMLPTWGDKWNLKWGVGPVVFNPENAFCYGRWLGERYKDASVIWILGGDRPVESAEHRSVIEAMASGLKEGDRGSHLMTFHPCGAGSSSTDFHNSDWLDFNMRQTGHDRNSDNWAKIAHDYCLTPIKPCMDGEPGYEDHVAGFDLNNGYLDDYDMRKFAYWALFSGACGHTYGCHPIWQMYQYGRTAVTHVRIPWQEALHLPGSGHMQHARALLQSRPFENRIPDQSLILSDPGVKSYHVAACRDSSGGYAFVYVPLGGPVAIDVPRLNGQVFKAAWYNPRTGASQLIGQIAGDKSSKFTPPGGGPDWVLTLDKIFA